MKKKSFWLFFLVMNIAFIFLKIYEHNHLANLSYVKQKLETSKTRLTKEKERLLVHLTHVKNQEKIASDAKKKFGFAPLKASQIISPAATAKTT